jgi:hypothetical protein
MTGDDVGKHMDDGFKKAGDGADDFKEEAGSTAREVAASFDGSADSIAGGFQELAANAFAGFGPAGAIAGLAAAAGIGVLFAQIQADSEAAEERVSAMYDDMLESGNRYLSAEFIQKGISEVVGDQDKYNKALAVQKDLGADISVIIRAMAGDQSAVNKILDDTNTKREDEIAAIEGSNDSLENKSIKIDAVNTKYGELTDQFYDVAASEDSAAARATAAQDATTSFLRAAIADAGTATEEVDEFGNKLYTLPDGEQILIDAETGQATTDVSNFKGDVDGIPETVNTAVKLTVDDTAWKNWVPQVKYGKVNAAFDPIFGKQPI